MTTIRPSTPITGMTMIRSQLTRRRRNRDDSVPTERLPKWHDNDPALTNAYAA